MAITYEIYKRNIELAGTLVGLYHFYEEECRTTMATPSFEGFIRYLEDEAKKLTA